MFTKMHEITIEAADAVTVANLLSKHRLWFHIGEEHRDYMDPERRWFRKVKIVATKWQIAKLCKAEKLIINCKSVD